MNYCLIIDVPADKSDSPGFQSSKKSIQTNELAQAQIDKMHYKNPCAHRSSKKQCTS